MLSYRHLFYCLGRNFSPGRFNGKTMSGVYLGVKAG
jgi:hypothetical protein